MNTIHSPAHFDSRLPTPHISEAPLDAPVRAEQISLDRINYNLGHLVKTGKFPADPVYGALKEKAYEATHDPLTDLLNRRGFEMAYNREMAADPDAKHALIVFDFDGFKAINDTMGHQAGDDLLKGVSKRWAESFIFRKDEIFARFGGDEFVLLAKPEFRENGYRIPHTPEAGVAGVITHTKWQAIEAGKKLELDFRGVSAGWAFCEKGKSLEDTLVEADKSLYIDKNNRKPPEAA